VSVQGSQYPSGNRKKYIPTQVKVRRTYVNVEFLGATKREQNVRENIDVVLVQQRGVVLNTETGVPIKTK